MTSEPDILRQIAGSRRKALGECYARYSSRVYNTALGYLRNKEDAEEATEDVFLEVFAHAASFEGRSSVSTWIYRITVRKCLDRLNYLNRKKRKAKLLSLFGERGVLINDVPHFDHPGIELERKEDARLLFDAIDQLPENQRTAFLLSQLEKLSGKEIADVMNTSMKAVESLIQRAKANLRKSLGNL